MPSKEDIQRILSSHLYSKKLSSEAIGIDFPSDKIDESIDR